MAAGSGSREPQAGAPVAGAEDAALARLADEQPALRRVARLVAHGAAPAEIFAAVAHEVGTLVGADVVHLARYEHDGVVVALAGWAREGHTLPPGASAPYRGRNISGEVLRSGRPVRFDDYGEFSGAVAERVRSLGLRAGVGAPILVDGRVWGVVVASSRDGPLPSGTEDRVAGFTELVASVVTNAASEDRWRRLTREPTALERVATLVARAAPEEQLLTGVAAEAGTLFLAGSAAVVRYEDEDEVTALGVWSATGEPPPVGSRWTVGDGDLWAEIVRQRGPSRAPAASDDAPGPLNAPFAAGCPVVVETEIWGALSVHGSEPLPPDAGSRLTSFAELAAAALSNARARTDARRLTDEQAALRRVATLVAREGSAGEVFDQIAHEMRALLDVEDVRLGRFDGDVLEIVAMSGPHVDIAPAGTRMPITTGLAARVHETGAPQRLDGDELQGGAITAVRGRGYQTIVAVPLTPRDELWGVLIAGARRAPFQRGIERRLSEYADLMGVAVANLQARETLERVLAEQEALRRVATLVARGTPPEEMFATVAREVGDVLGADAAHIGRFEADRTVVSVGQWGRYAGVPIGAGYPLDGDSVSSRVLATGQPARMDRYDEADGVIAATVREIGIRHAIGVPISLTGRPWGVMIVSTKAGGPFPAGTESRLQDFTDLVATAISNANALTRVETLAAEQAALRRVATLVARRAPPADVFDAVVKELGLLLGVESTGLVRFEEGKTATLVAGWGRLAEVVPVGARLPLDGTNVISQIARTGRPARVDDYGKAATGAIAERAHRLDTQASAGGPIVVAGAVWGAMVAAALEGSSLPEGTESRLEQFTELIGTAIANTEARVELARLADEQAALRRVATLVAEEAPAPELLAKVAEEAAGVFGDKADSAVLRYEQGDTASVVAVWGKQPAGGIRVGARLPVDGAGVTARVFRERRPVRVDDYGAADGAIAERAQKHAIRSAVGCPIVVHGRLWGAMVVARYEEVPFPADAERRVQQFTDLAATAIANAEARAEQQRLAAQQAALRRVATLVARAATPTEVFDAVIVEVAQLLGAAQVGMMRYDDPQEATIVAQRGQDPVVVKVGMRVPLVGENVTARVARTGRSARVNHYDESSGRINELALRTGVWATVGAPITVEGRTWGVITASWEPEHFPPADAEARVAEFAELVDTAIANADSRSQLEGSRARVLTAGDEARRRLVRDLHDGAQQRLVHTIISLNLARRELGEDRERAETLFAEALEQAEQANAALRELAHGILPAVLTRGGLPAALDSLVARLDLPVDVGVTSTRLPAHIEASAYFIAAEGLTNVVKHARAGRAAVTAAVDAGRLRVEVRDDGVGGADAHGHGLQGIADRAEALGGRLRIESPQGGGTVVTAELPLD